MNVERGAGNTLLVTARRTLSPSNWLLYWVKVQGGAVAHCITTNDGSSTGPLLLSFTETATPVDPDDVTLADGDWRLSVYEQTSDTNVLPTGRLVWVEQIRII